MEELVFAHISDSHIEPDKTATRHGVNPYDAFRRVLERISGLPKKPAFIVHTGDVVADPDVNSYKYALELCKAIDIPFYFVKGNHDDASGIINLACQISSDSKKQVSYSFNLSGRNFLVLDSESAPNPWCGILPDAQFQILEETLGNLSSSESLSIFLHYPPLPIGCPWVDNKMCLINGERFHSTLVERAKCKVNGVFFGHIHRGASILRDGILYSAAPAISYAFETFPGQVEIAPSRESVASFRLVTLGAGSTCIQDVTC